jgi:hypothetical protein
LKTLQAYLARPFNKGKMWRKQGKLGRNPSAWARRGRAAVVGGTSAVRFLPDGELANFWHHDQNEPED